MLGEVRFFCNFGSEPEDCTPGYRAMQLERTGMYCMNFLFLNSAGRGWGGNEKWTKLAAESLSGKHRAILAYRDPRIGDRFCIEKVRLPFLMELDPITISGLVRIIRREKVDVVIPTKRKDYVLAGIACRITGAANILRLGIDRPLQDTAIQKLVYGLFADGIVVNAARIRETLSRTPWLDTSKIRVIYNGIDRKALDQGSKAPYSRSFGFMIAAAGALIPRKGFDFLLRSFARFIETCAESTGAGLVIAGEGPERESLERLASKLGITDKVHFAGNLDNPYPMLLACDLFVSSSTSEGIANALLESMALGSVPVSTFSGGADELISDGRNGFLVHYGDEAHLASIFSDLLRNPEERQRLAANACETVTQQFSTERMRTDLLEFCSEILTKRRAA